MIAPVTRFNWPGLAPILLLLTAACQTGRGPRPPVGGISGSIDEIRALVSAAAHRHQVPRDLVLAVIAVESSFRPTARSRVGAAGLMQLMPRTAASLARRLEWKNHDVDDPAFNIEAGTYYLAYLIKRFNDVSLALAAYNAGPGRIGRLVRQGGSLPAYSRRYVAAVAAARRRFDGDASADHRVIAETMDRAGLRALLRRELAYGLRQDERLPQ